MPATLGALSNDQVGARFGRATCLMYGRDHVHCAQSLAVDALEQRCQLLLRGRPGRGDDLRTRCEDRVRGRLIGPEEQEVQSERPAGQAADALDERRDLGRRLTGAALNAEATGIRHRCHQLRAGSAGHTAEHDGMFDSQQGACTREHAR